MLPIFPYETFQDFKCVFKVLEREYLTENCKICLNSF